MASTIAAATWHFFGMEVSPRLESVGSAEVAHALCDERHEYRTEGREAALNGRLMARQEQYACAVLRFVSLRALLAGAFTDTSGSALALRRA
jgi:hypothetical protein